MKFPCGKGSNLVPFPHINQYCQPMMQQELAEKPYCLGEAPRDYYVIYQLVEGSIGLVRKMVLGQKDDCEKYSVFPVLSIFEAVRISLQ
jgi:hypothetical protein